MGRRISKRVNHVHTCHNIYIDNVITDAAVQGSESLQGPNLPAEYSVSKFLFINRL